MGNVGGQADKTVGARHRPGAPDVVTAGAPTGEGDRGSVPSAWERLRSRDLAVKVFVAGVTYVALAPFSQLGAIVGVMVSPIVSDLVKDYVERHRWSARRLRRRSAAVALLGHEEEAYAASRPGRGPGGGVPGALMASVAAVTFVTAGIATANIADDGHRSGTRTTGSRSTTAATTTRAGAPRHLARGIGAGPAGIHPVQTSGPNEPPVHPSPPPPPPPVIHLQGSSATADPPSLSWDRAAGADEYRLYRDEELVRSTTALSVRDAKATAGVHVYDVTVVVDGAEGKPSNSVTVDYEPMLPVLPGLPAPTGLTQTAPNAPAFVWQPVPGAAGYDVYRGRDLVKRVKEPAYEETDILPDGTYEYTVRTVDSFGSDGPESDVLSIQHVG